MAQTLQALGRIDVLVNNAGIYRDLAPLEVTEEHWDEVLGVNVKSVLFCAQAVLPTMLAAGRGIIVNVSSIAGKVASPHGPVYAASKAAMISLTRSLAKAYAGNGIRVNCVCPGFVDTPMWAEIDQRVGVEELGMEPGEFWQEQTAAIPVGRPAQPEDVANVVNPKPRQKSRLWPAQRSQFRGFSSTPRWGQWGRAHPRPARR